MVLGAVFGVMPAMAGDAAAKVVMPRPVIENMVVKVNDSDALEAYLAAVQDWYNSWARDFRDGALSQNDLVFLADELRGFLKYDHDFFDGFSMAYGSRQDLLDPMKNAQREFSRWIDIFSEIYAKITGVYYKRQSGKL